jgi:hypothetical protein
MDARPNWSQAGEVREATAAALRAVVNLETDAAMGTVSTTKAIEAGRAMGIRAVNDAAKVSGAQPRGAPESEIRGTMPFAMVRILLDDDVVHDGAVERLDAMREVLGDAYNRGEPIPSDRTISPPGHVAQAVGIAYAAEIIGDATLRDTVQSTIAAYLEKRPLQATPSQLQTLERLIRECAGAPSEEIGALCENFKRAQLTSGSVFRGAAPTATARRTLTAPPTKPKKAGGK